MPIRPSSGVEIRQLIDALGAADDVRQEAAIARLAVLGPRAIEHLLQNFSTATGRVRAGMLRAFEGAADPRTLPAARSALQDSSAFVQTAAIAALRALLSARPDVSRDALDALVTVALDRGRIAAVRIAAIDALREMPADVRTPLEAELASDPDPEVRARGGVADSAGDPWRDAVAGRLPTAPDTLKRALGAVRATARLTELQRVIDHVRAHEGRDADPAVREEWRAVRGALHQALAARNSRLALYDLRDSLMSADRLPVAFLAAIEEIGDATCLEPLAGAYAASSRSGDTWWREHVAAAFRAIVQREGLTRRHAAVKRAMTRWPDAAADLMARL
jgi:HEAT repeat protein